MVEYYNLSSFNNITGYIGVSKITSQLTNFYFGYGMITLLFLIIFSYNYQKNKEIFDALLVSSMYSILLSLFFYVAGIIINPYTMLIFVIIYIGTIAIRYYIK